MRPLAWFELPASDLGRAVRLYETLLAVTLKPESAGPTQMGVFSYELPLWDGRPGREAGGVIVHLNAEPSLDAVLALVNGAGERSYLAEKRSSRLVRPLGLYYSAGLGRWPRGAKRGRTFGTSGSTECPG